MAPRPNGLTDAFRHPTRRQIAFACLHRPKTVSAIAKELARQEGGLRATVIAMADEQILRLVPGQRAGSKAYQLREEWREPLEEAIDQLGIPGLMIDGHRLLLIERKAVRATGDVLRTSPLREDLSWGAHVTATDESEAVLLAFSDRQSVRSFQDFLSDLDAAGVKPFRMRVDSVDDAAAVRRYFERA